ncbi:DUF6527 family protein [Yersinia sp. 2544 StPb PI]|uniref:DUF6527 family protein n=1 Tax=Yersinia TaxID=629 RepID=UPI0005DABFF6|nr:MULTISPECIES: DUF6527 family protein [Yersinia]MCB5302946.1 hypothetical protein [Yersinia bercovieri]CQJ03924.1 Uncharacterised protein [Yersinia frederiksenii]
MNRPRWFLKLKEFLMPARRVIIIEGDTPPLKLPLRNLVIAREDNEDWAVAFRCPCGCGKRLELLLIKEAKPNWSINVDQRNIPTLTPSVWLQKDCKSHFWLRNGKIIWV